jgi:hypothetical protein
LLEQQMSNLDESQSHSADRLSPWTPKVRSLLVEWCDRADAASQTHFAMANRFSRRNLILGIPVVVLTALVGTSVFATLQEETVNTRMRIFAGVAIVLASVLASLQTFLNFGEKAEKNRAAAENWAAIRREIKEMLALHPAHIATRGDPKAYLDELRERIDAIAQESPDMPERLWASKTRATNMDEVSRESPDMRHHLWHRLWARIVSKTRATDKSVDRHTAG